MSLISYFVPKILYSGNSDFNKDIKIIEVTGTYKLIVNGIVQSYGDNSGHARKRVWGKMAGIVLKKPQLRNLLLLGMGAGTFLKFIQNNCRHPLSTTGVEIDPLIITLSRKYFSLDQLDNNRVVEGDAYDVVSDPSHYGLKAPFDCVVVDTYFGSEYPDKLNSDTFYKNVVSLMHPGALLMVNRLINKGEEVSLSSITDQLAGYIKPLQILKVKSPVISDNYIFYGPVV